VLWHGGQLSSPPVDGVELRDASEIIKGSPIEEVFNHESRHHNHASCADLFRYQLLYTLGGAYCDIDIHPGKKAVPALLERSEPVFGSCWWQRHRTLEIRFIVCPQAEHPLLEALRDTAVANQKAFIEAGGYRVDENMNNVLWRTGPGMARIIVNEYARKRGKRSIHYRLALATVDNTKENNGEHFVRKLEKIREAANLT
jgi:mannosyltransferase OCH1-like enzyme